MPVRPMNRGAVHAALISVALLAGGPPRAGRPAVAVQDLPIRMDVDVGMTMRDGVRLSTDIYRPDAPGRFPAIVHRTPYNNNERSTVEYAQFFASRGYVFVTQDTRGRYDSAGDWRPLVDDGRDGYDTIAWAAAQPWSSGTVGTFGISYPAWNQWFAASLAPPALRTMISIVSPADPFLDAPYHGGAFELLMARWMLMMSTRTNQEYSMYDMARLYKHLPLRTLDEAAGRRVTWWREWTEHDTLDAYWKERSYQRAYEKIQVPVLHVDGWFDDDLVASLTNYTGMRTRGGSAGARRGQKLLIGPWPHAVNRTRTLADIDFGPDAIIDLNAVYLRWFDCHLKRNGCGELMSEPPVRLFVMGDNRWRSEEEWPPARAERLPLYFHSQGRANTLTGDGTLQATRPGPQSPDRFTYDPRDPVPTVYGPGEVPKGTVEDQRAVEARPDVLVYTGAPLVEPLEVTGPLEVKLWAASSAPIRTGRPSWSTCTRAATRNG